MKRATLILLLTVFLSAFSVAQATQEDKLGCATGQSKSLNFLVGKWDVKSRFRLSRSDDKWETTEAVSEIKHLFKDCVYQELLEGTRDRRPHQLIGFYSFNNISNKFQWVGGHSEHGLLALYEGIFENGTLILENETAIRDNTVYFRLVITQSVNGFTVRSERSTDKKMWDMNWLREYTKFVEEKGNSVSQMPPVDENPLTKGIDHGFPGIILAVQKGSKPVEIKAAGFADLENSIPIEPDDRFHIASVTKLFTAVAALMLVDEGKLSLDTKIADILDKKIIGRIPNIEQITVSQLLDHSSGIYGFNNDKDYIDIWLGSKYEANKIWSSSELIAFADGGRAKPFGKPGTGHFYSDTNYVLLLLIIEETSGMTLRQYVKRRILEPLRLINTGYYGDKTDSDLVAVPTTVEGYLKRSSEIDSVVQLEKSFEPVGDSLVNTTRAVERLDGPSGMVSTAHDLAVFGRALYSGKLLKKKTMKWLLSIGDGIEKEPAGTSRQGVMKVHLESYGVLYASAGDGPAGINAVLAYHPGSDTVMVGFTNIFGLFDEADFMREHIFSVMAR